MGRQSSARPAGSVSSREHSARERLLSDESSLLSDDPRLAQRSAVRIEQFDRAVHGGARVAVVRWPEQRSLADQIGAEGLPRLLLLEPLTAPVVIADRLEDWVRLPVSVLDLRARIHRLRSAAHPRQPRPVLDGRGRLLYDGRWVGLSPIQERLAGPLVARFGRPVRNGELLGHGWPDGGTPVAMLRTRVRELRQRVEGLDLDISTIRAVGYLLHTRTAPGAAPCTIDL